MSVKRYGKKIWENALLRLILDAPVVCFGLKFSVLLPGYGSIWTTNRKTKYGPSHPTLRVTGWYARAHGTE